MNRGERPVVPVPAGRPLREAAGLLLLSLLLAAAAWAVRTPRLPLRADAEFYTRELPAPPVDTPAAVALYREGRAIFVDTRPDGRRRRIPDAFPLRPDSFAVDYRTLFEFTSPADTLVLYGDGDLTALAAPAARLKEKGYEHLLLLRGDLRAWHLAGGELADDGNGEEQP